MAGDQSIARENFRRLAALRGWTAKEIAVKIGISEGALYNWTLKTSPTNLGSGSLVRLADLFSVEAEQFIATNILELSRFEAAERKITVKRLVDQYNKIVAACEKDPSLRVAMDDST